LTAQCFAPAPSTLPPLSTLQNRSNIDKLPRANFGLLEHLRETRFGVPKITFIVTPPFTKCLKNQADLRVQCSKNARIRASWVKFQKSKNPMVGVLGQANCKVGT
jgi:hypothetical protein